MAHQLTVQNLSKAYPTPTGPLPILRDVALTLGGPGNDQLAIAGPSGSGKSTLLHILGTLDRPTAGTVTLDGTDPFTLADAALARFRSERIGFVFQEHHLLGQCTALENVLVARLAMGPVRGEDQTRARELLESVGLADRATHFPSELSGGERQRVAIARALMNRPAMLLCDEPTGNLDAATAGTIGDLLHQVAAKSDALLICVTHSAKLAATFPRRLQMRDGALQDIAEQP